MQLKDSGGRGTRVRADGSFAYQFKAHSYTYLHEYSGTNVALIFIVEHQQGNFEFYPIPLHAYMTGFSDGAFASLFVKVWEGTADRLRDLFGIGMGFFALQALFEQWGRDKQTYNAPAIV